MAKPISAVVKGFFDSRIGSREDRENKTKSETPSSRRISPVMSIVAKTLVAEASIHRSIGICCRDQMIDDGVVEHNNIYSRLQRTRVREGWHHHPAATRSSTTSHAA
eukprot:scaffold4954_cov106-Cylindrotheca_fusiformis.AAC.6